MPTYAFECTSCGHEFDVFTKMTANPRSRKCPVCGKRAKRLISGGAGFLLKGEGFYATDYRSEEYRSKAKAEEGKSEDAKPESTDNSDKESAPKKKKKDR